MTRTAVLITAAALATASEPQSVAFVARWGGVTKDIAYSAVLDERHGLFVVGAAYSADFPTTSGRTRSEQWCAFGTKLDAQVGSLTYSTVLCARGMVWGRTAAVGANGELWVAGSVDGPGLPTTANAPQRAFGGWQAATGAGDAFVARWSPDGSAVPYATYLGGSGDEGVAAALADERGVWVVGGTTSRDFPTSANAPQRTLNGVQDAFIAHVAADGALRFSTYFGGPGDDRIAAIARLDRERVVVAGTTTSSGVTSGAVVRKHFDGFVAVFNTGSGVLEWWKNAGGAGDDQLRAVTVLDDGTVVAAGDTASSCAGARKADAWIVLTARDGTPRGDYCLGGSELDEIHGVVAAGSSVWVTGRTFSTDFPITVDRGRVLTVGYERPFVAQLAPLQRKVLSARILTSAIGRGFAVARGPDGIIYVTGETTDANRRFRAAPEHEIRATKGALGFGQLLHSTDPFVIALR